MFIGERVSQDARDSMYITFWIVDGNKPEAHNEIRLSSMIESVNLTQG